jgi:hypothetical protein
MDRPALEMTIDLNVLNHLGIRLYSNIAAVLSEAVANAWDADAQRVDVTYDTDSDSPSITIEDDGCGMDRNDVISKYLKVGYERRRSGADQTAGGRPVMGRKGIGKLSLLSIAENVAVHTVTDRGDPVAFQMNRKAIDSKASSGEPYRPEEIPAQIDAPHGTRIHLTGLTKRFRQSKRWLRTRLARRFSIIGQQHRFIVSVNGEEVGLEERDYLKKLQFAWWYGCNDDLRSAAINVRDDRQEERPLQVVVDGHEYNCGGWIGTCEKSGESMQEDGESINRITLVVRGKVAHENLLMHLGETGHYSSYLIGEVSADFLDDTDQDDIATSNRQQIDEADPRFAGLISALRRELDYIQGKWQEWRQEDGVRAASQFPSIRRWLENLQPGSRNKAKRMLGLINRITNNTIADRRELYKNAVIAFETLRARDQLDRVNNLKEGEVDQLLSILCEIEEVERSRYYQLVRERYLRVKRLQELVADSKVKERDIQKYLFDNIWLVNPAWERATEDEYIETSLGTLAAKSSVDEDELGKAGAALGLSAEHRRQRLDVKFRVSHGKHIIVELKKPDISVTFGKLWDQCASYRDGIKKILTHQGKQHEAVEVVFLTGKGVQGWDVPEKAQAERTSLANNGIFVYHYDELVEQAKRQNLAFLDAMKDAGRVSVLLEAIDTEEPVTSEAPESRGTPHGP